MKRFWTRYVSERSFRAAAHYLLVVAAGFVVMGIAWHGVAAQTSVSAQIPYLVSGGLGGLALVVIGIALLAINHDRRLAARVRRAQEDLLVELLARTQHADERPD
ncbi:MAG TPA: hypothetical protein VL961_04175 [Acidimicrobiales bacterium]|nr:hypothetical protein [Acidimicrobiales bacterium]